MGGSSQDHPFLRLTFSVADPADDPRLRKALVEIARDHPRVSINTQPKDGLYSLEGRAESDLYLVWDSLRDEYDLTINADGPKVILLETFRAVGEAQGKYIRQIGGSGNYGHCKLRVEPNAPSAGYEFRIQTDAVPSGFVESIEQGIQDEMARGVLGGHPVVDVRVTLVDGSYHEVDSNQMAFGKAGSIGFREAAKNALPILLEPMMSVEIHAPDYPPTISTIEREISQHRGRIDRRSSNNGWSDIRAIVPLSNLLASDFSPLTESQMTFAGYEAVSDDGSNESGPSVIANKPDYPLHGRDSAAARPDPSE